VGRVVVDVVEVGGEEEAHGAALVFLLWGWCWFVFFMSGSFGEVDLGGETIVFCFLRWNSFEFWRGVDVDVFWKLDGILHLGGDFLSRDSRL